MIIVKILGKIVGYSMMTVGFLVTAIVGYVVIGIKNENLDIKIGDFK